MNSCNDNQKQVFKLISSLASINNTKQEAEQAKKFVEENWDEFRRDFESTLTKERCSTGEIERVLFKLIATVCDWKTNKDYMRIASQIMILCGYNSYKKENRFNQKIQNILKKEKKRLQLIEGKKRKRTNKKKEIESDISVSINQDIKGISSSIDQETDEQQPVSNQNEILSENTLINKDCRPSVDEDYSNDPYILHSYCNNDNPLLRQSVPNDFDYNNYHNPMFQEDYFSDELYPYDFDLNDLSYPCEYPAYQHNLSDNIIF